jgi:TetR/AcrR family transcriptional regulator, cholesterol catabolism regulator
MVNSPPPRKVATSGIEKRRDSARKEATDAYRERRREIALAAASVFNRRGYQGTTIGAVADEMGTDRASLYYYISSKEELFDEVVREVSEENVARAESIRASDAPAPDKLRALIESLMESYSTHYPILYVYIREDLSHVAGKRTAWSKYMQGLNRRYEGAIIDIVQEGMDNGCIRPVASARVIAFGIIGMIGWTNRWFDPHRSPDSAEDIASGFAEMVLAGLRTDR